MMSKKSCDKRKYFRFWDVIPLTLILFVLFLGIWRLFGASDNDGLIAVIAVNSEEYSRVDLSEVEVPYDLIVPVGEDEVVVHIAPDGVCIKESPCSDKLCINTGELTKSGQSAVCLPMRVSLILISDDRTSENVPDGVAG